MATHQFYTRPGNVSPERCPTDLCREQGNMINVWSLSDADVLALDDVIAPLANRLRLGLPREHVRGQAIILIDDDDRQAYVA